MTGAFLKPLRAPEPQFVAQAVVFLTLVPRSARINFPEQAELSAFTLILNTKPPSSLAWKVAKLVPIARSHNACFKLSALRVRSRC